MRSALAATMALAATLVPSAARAQATVVDAFSAIPGGVFYNVIHPSPCGAHFHDPIQIDAGGGETVTVSYYSETQQGNYLIGCIDYSETSVNLHVANDPAVDPGDFIGEYTTPNTYGDLILNFSEPLTGYGSTSILGPFTASSRPNNADRFIVYDDVNGTGNVIADITTDDIINLQLRRDFKGVHVPTPQIRSVRYINVFPSLSIDGFAVAVAAEPVDVPAGLLPGAVLALGPPVPNPFISVTRFALDVPQAGRARVEVFSISGRRVRVLLDSAVPAGRRYVAWDGLDARGSVVPAGVYLVRAAAGAAEATVRAMRVK